jgi:hypothetical protein
MPFGGCALGRIYFVYFHAILAIAFHSTRSFPPFAFTRAIFSTLCRFLSARVLSIADSLFTPSLLCLNARLFLSHCDPIRML